MTQVVVQVMRDGHSEEVELTQTNGQWRLYLAARGLMATIR
ncbi:large repetitive protein [Salmonella enterica subsp. enterica]|uniref:Large repetitive protein n=1 Tax=Salmonella enterica I TaxID=59201 RepID=A0A379VZJ8_SALET|nr:large repetitive protein [Salmonella enterica subsp. enterica]